MNPAVKLDCASCGCRVSDLPITLRAEAANVEHGLFCPACGNQQVSLGDGLAAAGVFVRNGRFCRWRGGADRQMVRIGKVTIGLDEVENLDLRTICFQSIPRLLKRDGSSYLAEVLPVRPEYIDLVDAVVSPPMEKGGRYTTTIQFKGTDRPESITLPFAAGPQADVRGLRVALWPDVAIREWSFFLLGSWIEDPGDQLRSRTLTVQPVYATGAGGGTANPTCRLDVSTSRCVRQLEGRPAYVAVAVAAAQGAGGESGCVLRVREATQTLRNFQGEVSLGVDFGTSNTYVAFKAGSAFEDPIHEVPWRDLDLVLVDGAPRPGGLKAPETWPPQKGYPPHSSSFPSLLLTVRPAAECNPDASTWKIGEDCALGTIADELDYNESEHTVRNIKYFPSTPAGRLANDEGRVRYLESLLVLVLANLAADDTVHFGTAKINWSYPLVFKRDGELYDKQAEAFKAAARWLERATGYQVVSEVGPDEATVTSFGTTGQEVTDVLYVDMGGGTVDVLFAAYDPNPASERPLRLHGLSSFGFAGEDYVNMLVEGEYLRARMTREQFLRKVRSQARLTSRFADECFETARQPVARKRSLMFYGYLGEYMARMIAARMLDGSALDTIDNEYLVSVNLLGNGWGFLGLTTNDLHRYMENYLQQRVLDLCEAEKDRAPAHCAFTRDVRFRLECVGNREIHPKQVVAHGLLKSQGPKRKHVGNSFGVLGLSTAASSTVYPWYLPLVDMYDARDIRLQGYSPPTGRILWREGDDPGFPEHLPTLFEIDEGLRKSHSNLLREVPAEGNQWFGRNVLEVVYETVVRPNLHRIAKVTY